MSLENFNPGGWMLPNGNIKPQDTEAIFAPKNTFMLSNFS
jgi:hypothetical protein